MRSEERAGIVAAVLLLLWGTILTFPLHKFTVFLEGSVHSVIGGLSDKLPAVVMSLITIVILTAVEVGLLLLSRTRLACYIPAAALFLTSMHFVIRSIRYRSFDSGIGITLAVILIITALLHLFRAEKILLWEGDFFIFAISAHLLTSLVAAPLSSYEVMDKIIYMDHFHDTDMSVPFAGFLTLPAFVWGLFFMIIVSLPVIYYSFSRRKA